MAKMRRPKMANTAAEARIASFFLLPLLFLARHSTACFSVNNNRLMMVPKPSHSLRTIGGSITLDGDDQEGSSCCTTTTELGAVSKRQIAVFDGPEFDSIQSFFRSDDASSVGDRWRQPQGVGRTSPLSSNRNQNGVVVVGSATFVAGTTEGEPTSRRIVGVEVVQDDASSSAEDDDDDAYAAAVVSLGGGTFVHRHTVADIPRGVSDDDAISTAAGAFVVHCVVPRIEGVGGSGDKMVSGKAVVLGGSDYACFAAEGLAALGADVSLITTRNNLRVKDDRVNVMGPAVGELKLGFADVIGQFDSLLDTLGNEAKFGEFATTLNDDNDLDDGDSGGAIGGMGSGGVLDELKNQHGCHRYVSSLTHSQKMIVDEGVLFGPNKVKGYESKIRQTVQTSSRPIIPPKDFGSFTLQTLLDQGVVLSSGKNKKEDVCIRGWSLKDFLELTSWPRDSAGGGNVRFGLPVVDDIDVASEREDLILSPPAVGSTSSSRRRKAESEREEVENPFVLSINGLEGLHRDVLSAKRDCVLFLSAPFCRTCRSLSPQFTRMAKLAKENDDSHVTFAKADTTGKHGKQLAKALDVPAVPTFLLFKDGERYGDPVSASRLPSKKLTLAVEYLESGFEWDRTAFREEES